MRKITEFMERKRKAIEDKNEQAYLNTITNKDRFYFKEQKYWFNDMIKEEIEKLSFEVINCEQVDKTYFATINQKHYMNEWFDITYELVIKDEEGELKDYGLNFEVIESDDFIVKYIKGDSTVNELIKYIQLAFDNVSNIFKTMPDINVEFKFYNEKEMVRQRSAPSLKWQFLGWAEPEESIKFYSGLEPIGELHGLIQHELVHLITLKDTNKNVMGWMAEGMAMKYGDGSYDMKDDFALKYFSFCNVSKSLNELMSQKLYEMTDSKELIEYYSTCYSYFDYLDYKYGVDALMNVFIECGKTESVSSKEEKEVISRRAFMKVLGVTFEDISEGYINWLNN